MSEKRKKETVYLKMHESFVKEGLKNSKTGEEFNIVTLPRNTFIDGKDVGGYKFSPLFVNKPALFSGNQLMTDENGNVQVDKKSPMRVMPMLAESEIWLRKPDEETIKVSPQALDEALKENRVRYREEHQKQDAPVEDETIEEYKESLQQQFEEITPADLEPEMTREEMIEQRKAEVRANRLSPAESIKQSTLNARANNEGLKSPAQTQSKPSL